MSPGKAIREELGKRGWGQEDLSRVMGRPLGRINEIIQGKQAISAEIALELASAFGNSPEEWMRLESNYRLSLARNDSVEVRRRARVFELGPIKEMVKRGWINASHSADGLEREVMQFYQLKDINETPSIHGAMRKTGNDLAASSQQMAWGFRVRKLAAAIPPAALGLFNEGSVENCKRDLRKLAAYSAEVRKVPSVLMSYGIRFVIVEGLSGAKMDGFATWLDERSPVIGMSLRRNQLHSFWFTLGHEIEHIKHKDIAPIDGSIGGGDDWLDPKPPMERRADAASAAMFINPSELESFIDRVHPMYSIDRINQFANSIKMHPSIIIGQLKHLGKVGYSQFAKPTYPIRELVVKSAVADGWGKSIYPGALA